MVELYGNQPDTSWTWDVESWLGYTFGTRFQVTASVDVHQVGYWRGSGGAGPQWIGLYGPGGGVLWSLPFPTDDGTAGWKWFTVSPAITLSTASTYTVAANVQGSMGVGRNNTPSTRVAAPSPFLFDDIPLHNIASSGPAYPTDPLTTVYMAFSVSTSAPAPPTPPGPGAGDPTLTGDLNSWLSSSSTVNTHQTDGLPWLSKQQLDAIEALANLIKTGVDNVPKSSDPLWLIASKAWQIAGALTDLEIAAWNVFAQRAPAQLTGSSGGGGSAFFSPDGRQVAASAAEAVDWGARQWHRTETTNWLVPVPGTDWELSDTIDFDGPLAWDVPADAYVCTFSTWPETADQETVVGRLYLPRAAWWAPVTADLTHERHFCDLSPQVLHALPMRCQGILFNPRNNYTGTLQAYLRPDPTLS